MPERKPLTAELIRALIDYDPESGLLTWRPRPLEMFPAPTPALQRSIAAAWNEKNAGQEACACIDGGYKTGGLFYNKLRAHRAAWAIVTGEMPKGQIDHINGDGTDNRWVNLRLVCGKENARNQKRHVTNISGHTGVCWSTRHGKWYAYVWAGTTNKKLGYYASLDDAALAARTARQNLGYHANHGSAR